jgi:hypothetical protein
MSFSEAIAKAKAAAETENSKKEDEEDDEELELRMPGSFDLGNNGAAAPATGAAGGPATVEPLDVVGVLGNVWRRMQLR